MAPLVYGVYSFLTIGEVIVELLLTFVVMIGV